LEAIDQWGVERALREAVGMFAFAVWDRAQRVLWLARDRLGEKPLFYGWAGSTFLFASELKALRVHPGWRGAIDRESLLEYVRFSYVASPRSIYCGIAKLVPGCYTRVSAADKPGELEVPRQYWRASVAVGTGDETRDPEAAILELEGKLTAAVKAQLTADVPVGAFLSGGIDSTMIVALIQRHSERAARTFTIGFQESAYDETKHAALVARSLGTEHTEAYVSSRDALALIPRLPSLYDEPHADPSQIPTYFVARLARDHVTVALSGDGGDELFCGYSSYFLTEAIWRTLRWVPAAARKALGASICCGTHLVRGLPPRRALDKLFKLATAMNVADEAQLFEHLADSWRDQPPVVDAHRVPWWRYEALELMARDPWLGMSMQDLLTYMPDAILTKVDRAAMAVSLETRVPFLDHTVVEYAMSLPTGLKVHDGRGKLLLRQLLERYVPRELFDRPKSGFSVPIGEWLRGTLRDWAEELLSARSLGANGYFETELVRRRWKEHARGYRDWSAGLWNVLMFQAWIAEQK
jgi:asparagine synthase (glutamine-hydrolysing)